MSIKKSKSVKYSVDDAIKDFGPITFGELLTAYRLGEDMTQVEMAHLLEISKQSLCDLEKGRTIPTVARATQIAKKLKVLPEFFIRVVMEDLLRRENLNFEVELRKRPRKVKTNIKYPSRGA
jgi:transcriptional regulator with XRE-family HTH domain